MPLQQRVIEPVNVSRSTLPLPPGDIKPLIKSIAAATGQGLAAEAAAGANLNIVNELECVTNGTLANLIRQLSSLSRQAEELLTGVFDDASKILNRTVVLQRRMDALAIKVEALDQPNDVSITLRDPNNQHETFSSDMSCDQQVLSKQQMPSSIAELYQTCDKPPPLNKLDPYRDDGKDGLKFYTDPTYFFELWKKDMMEETLKAPLQQQQHRHQQVPKHNQATRSLQQQQQQQQKRLSQHHPQQQMQQQQYQANKARQQVVSINGSYTSSTTYVSSVESNQDIYGHNNDNSINQIQRNSVDVERSAENMARYLQQTTLNDDHTPIYQQHQAQAQQQAGHYQSHQQHQPQPQQQQQYELLQKQHQHQQSQQSQPAQSANISIQQQYQQTPYVSNNNNNHMHMLATPPPPPPALSPLPAPTSPPPPPPPPAPPAPPAPPPAVTQPPPVLQPPTAAELQQKQQQLRKTVPVQRDPRSDLLAAIKQGITLRRVEDSKRRVEAEKQQSMGNDVASILARRVAMQVSDSDDNGDDDEEDNDWDDASNR